MRHRTKKQIGIAILFLGFWGLIGSGIVFATRGPAPPPTPTPVSFKPVRVLSTSLVRTSEATADLVALLENPNADAGARSVPYIFQLLSGGAVHRTIPGETFLLPGRQKAIVAVDVPIPAGDVTLNVQITQPQWTVISDERQLPSFVLVNRTTSVRSGTPAVFELKGLLANQSDVGYARVEITALGFDTAGNIIGASHTFAGSMRAGERREFTAQWPRPSGIEVARTHVVPEVNIFAPDALQVQDIPLRDSDVPRPSSRP